GPKGRAPGGSPPARDLHPDIVEADRRHLIQHNIDALARAVVRRESVRVDGSACGMARAADAQFLAFTPRPQDPLSDLVLVSGVIKVVAAATQGIRGFH